MLIEGVLYKGMELKLSVDDHSLLGINDLNKFVSKPSFKSVEVWRRIGKNLPGMYSMT